MLKRRILKYLTKPAPAQDISEVTTYVDARDIGILFTENTEAMKNFGFIEKELLADQKNIFPLMRVVKREKEKTYRYPFFTSRDITLLGKMKSDTLSKYTSRTMDMVLLLDDHPDELTKYIASKCQCPLRIGFTSTSDINSETLNFIVKPKHEERKHQALMDYLRMIS
ncbi:MAG: hypothetical protein AAGA85_10650 [Bacteroidota bacterium]